jgi:hypothetical protein
MPLPLDYSTTLYLTITHVILDINHDNCLILLAPEIRNKNHRKPEAAECTHPRICIPDRVELGGVDELN